MFGNTNSGQKHKDCDFWGQFGKSLFQILKAYAKMFTKMPSYLVGGWGVVSSNELA